MRKSQRWVEIISVAILSLALLGGCSKKSLVAPTGAAPNGSVSAACLTKPAAANDLFATDFYNQHKGDSGNIFFSPFSISSALAMTAEGAKGQTASEMWSVLKVETDPATRQADYSAVFGVLNSPNNNYQLSTSNDLWVEQTFPLLPSYLNVVQGAYHAGLTPLDFIGSPDPSRTTINYAVANQTAGKITNLLPAGSITDITRLVLTNAIYFKADWAVQFTAANSLPGAFNVTPTSQVTPQMMRMTYPGTIEDFNGTAKVLELPYVNKDVSMFVFLPNGTDTSALEANLNTASFEGWLAARQAPAPSLTQVDLELPKFQFSTSYSLNDTLAAMGMPTAFIKGAADFSGMASLPPREHLFISNVIHKAFVAVDEKGTEAAAATAVVIGVTFSAVTQPIQTVPFHVDHPFIFVIYENRVKTILFMGRVNDPTAS